MPFAIRGLQSVEGVGISTMSGTAFLVADNDNAVAQLDVVKAATKRRMGMQIVRSELAPVTIRTPGDTPILEVQIPFKREVAILDSLQTAPFLHKVPGVSKIPPVG